MDKRFGEKIFRNQFGVSFVTSLLCQMRNTIEHKQRFFGINLESALLPPSLGYGLCQMRNTIDDKQINMIV